MNAGETRLLLEHEIDTLGSDDAMKDQDVIFLMVLGLVICVLYAFRKKPAGASSNALARRTSEREYVERTSRTVIVYREAALNPAPPAPLPPAPEPPPKIVYVPVPVPMAGHPEAVPPMLSGYGHAPPAAPPPRDPRAIDVEVLPLRQEGGNEQRPRLPHCGTPPARLPYRGKEGG